jgi:hypothetical protein
MQIFRALRLGVAILLAAATASAQAPRASDGHPDLSGIWQAMGTANWDLEDHPSEAGPFYQLGATFPLTSEPGYEIFEYARHEGNYAMRNRLSAARALEAKDAKDAAAKK